jgi:hypothetical protein
MREDSGGAKPRSCCADSLPPAAKQPVDQARNSLVAAVQDVVDVDVWR